MDRRIAVTTGLAALVVAAAAWTARSRAPTFEDLQSYEVITCELAEPLDAEGWIDFVHERGRAVARGRTLYLQIPRRYFVGIDGTVVLAGGNAARVRIEPWQSTWGPTQRCTGVVPVAPAPRVDFEVTNALPGGRTVVHACDQTVEVHGGRATVWVPPGRRSFLGEQCVAWASRWDQATSSHDGPGPFLPAQTPLVRLELPPERWGGIGANLVLAELWNVVPGGPAERAGLHERDVVLSIDGAPLDPEDIEDDPVDRLLGPEGTSVRLEVRERDGGAVRTVTLERAALFDPRWP